MAKYKVGQKVRLRKDLELWKGYGSHHVNTPIYEARGEFVTIVKVDNDYSDSVYRVKELYPTLGITEGMLDHSYSKLTNFLKELQCTK